jgi:hypothetical protein
MSGIRISFAPSGEPGRARIIAEVPRDGGVMLFPAGTAKSISAGFWEAELDRSSPERGPQGPEPGRGPMEYGKAELRAVLEKSANEDGPWWPEGAGA